MNRKRIISAALGVTLAMSAFTGFAGITAGAAANTPKYQETAREMEKLNRGLIAVKNTSGVYLSWRLLGDESLENQAFDIYKNGAKLATTGAHDATCYTDKAGTVNDKYAVVPAGKDAADEPQVQAEQTKGNATYTYFDVPISMPIDIPHANTTALSDYKRVDIKDKNGKNAGTGGGANDASLGDLDGDGDYEIVLKWDPNDSKDSSSGNTTGHCVFDAYEIDPNNGGYMWRIDIGNNIAAGAHYSQFMVYDLDGDGKAEIATITAPGSYSLVKNDAGEWEKIYVTTVGDTETIRNADNNATTLRKGNNNGPEYYTIFDGETGRPLYTTDAIPLGPEDGSYWGDAKMNRSERYLAAVAYLDGVHPSYIPIRGMYNRTIIRAYNWDGETLSLQWEHNGDTKGTTMYGEGNHNLNIADIDNDGKDEIVYGSACLDDDGKTILGNTKMGHGDAMHTSDFNNDGKQEVFSVKEDKEGYSRAADFRVAETGNAIWSKSITSGDNGRGFMDNVCDEYAAEHPEALALGFSASTSDVYDFNGNSVGVKPSTSRPMMNFGVYWDADLGRELLDDTIMGKYTYNKSTGKVEFGRIFFEGGNYLPATANNSTKYTPCLVADLWGDWREEIIMAVDDRDATAPKLRIITPIATTQYRLHTLMHDSQYRTAIAWQNVGYNQPPHTSYYIGSAALATDGSGNKLNYLAPAYPFTKIKYASSVIETPVTGITLSESNLKLEKGQTASVQAIIEPENADKKTVTWSTSDAGVATVANGTITATGKGTATITATAKDTTNGTLSAQCQVEVYSTDVKGLNFPGYDNITIMQGGTAEIKANVVPENATDKLIHWTSTNPNAVTVDANGTVTGVGPGSSIVRAVTDEGGFTGEKIVSVAGNLTDKTGDDPFTSTSTGTGTTIDNLTKNSGTINHKDATDAASIQKDFEVIGENKVTLTFNFVTGGQKLDGSNWNWTGHEYSMGVQLLDENGENILELLQQWAAKAADLQSKKLDGEYTTFSKDWTMVVDGIGNISGSAKRWMAKFEFDYANDTCNASVIGTDDGWVNNNGQYDTSFKLNGKKFKTLKVYTRKDGTGTITANPTLTNVTYTQAVPTDGVGSKIYDKATIDSNKWTDADVSEWTATGGTPAVTADGFGFNVHKPGASYSASKAFTLEKDALVTYDADWHYLNTTGREGNTEYLQLGPVKIAAGNGGGSADTEFTGQYFTKVSLDGGATWCDFDNDGKADNISAGSNAVLDKNVSLVIDTKTNTIKSLNFGGTVIAGCTNKVLDGSPDYTKISLGFERGGSTNDVDYVNMIKNLTVLQFIDGAEQPSTPAPELTPEPTEAPTDEPIPTDEPKPTDEPTASPEPTEEPVPENITVTEGSFKVDETGAASAEVTNGGTAAVTVSIISAAYDADGRMVSVKFVPKTIEAGASETLTTGALAETTDDIRAYLWSMNGYRPVADNVTPEEAPAE